MARPFALLALFVALSLLRPGAGAAQDATPVASSAPTDLAAMALAPDDVPAGFFDDYNDWWVPAAGVVDLGVLGGAAAPPGLDRMYQSFYTDPETGLAIHCYLFEFASPEQAAAGAAVADAALRPPLPEGETVGPTHAPGPAVGEEPRTTTSVTYDTRAAGGPRADVVAATFRRGSLVAGVAVERFADPPGDGAPAAAAATPAAPDPALERLAARLAGTLDGRITDVLAGRAPAGVDPALAEAVLPLDRLVGPATPVFGGYMAGIDLLRCGVCGEENSLVRFGDAALGGVVRAVVAGPLVDGEPQPPFVGVAVSAFASPDDALAVLEAMRAAPNDRATAFPVPRGARTPAADPAIPGATAALAYHGALDGEDPDAPLDSAGVAFVLGDRLVTIDVQGGLSADEAMAAVVDLAAQQASCLSAGGACTALAPPPALIAGEDGAPTAATLAP